MKFILLFTATCGAFFIPQLCHSQGLPINPTRTISFSTTEGSYMNVDVSPDGKYILFDLLGDIYCVSSSGGKAKQLTRGIALNLRPVWAPDGAMIAYISDRSGSFLLNVMDLKETYHTVLGNYKPPHESFYPPMPDWNPVWSPDGRFIAFDKKVYTLYGKELTAPFAIPNPIRFTSDGQWAYGLDSGKLYRYNVKANTFSAISATLGEFKTGAISPDGRWWCFIADSNKKLCLFAQDLHSNEIHLLISSLIQIDPRYRQEAPDPHFSFSPDSKALYIGYGGKIHRITLDKGANEVIPFLAQAKVDLGRLNKHTFPISYDSFSVKYIRFASTSPDGKRLAFSALAHIYVVDLPGGKPHQLVSQPFGQFQPAWSPDSRWIAYTTWCDTTGGFLWRAPASGGLPEQLTNIAAQYQAPNWSPDGNSIAVIKGPLRLNLGSEPNYGQLQIISLTGSSILPIADSVPLTNNVPTFSLDGHRIFYTPKYELGSDSEIQFVSKDILTQDLKTIALGADHTAFVQKSLSPDNHYFVYSADEDLYVVPVSPFSCPFVFSSSQDYSLDGIRFAAGVDPHWEDKGRILAWTYANHFYRIAPEKILAKAEKERQTISQLIPQPGQPITIGIEPDSNTTIQLKAQSSHAQGTIALRNVRIITMQGNRVIEHATLIIRNGRILDMGPMSNIQIPASAKIFDVPGTTVMPGLIDIHLHEFQVSASIYPQQTWQHLTDLAYGITTARDPAQMFDAFGYAELLHSGQMLGPRMYNVGHAIRFPDGVFNFNSLRDAKDVLQKRVSFGATEIKQYALPSRLQRQWLLQACQNAGVNMTNEGPYNPILTLAMIKDGTTGIEHNPVWGDVYNDVISLVGKSGTYITPTLQVCYGAEPAKTYFEYKYWHHPDTKWIHFVYNSAPHFSPTTVANSQILLGKPPKEDTLSPGFFRPSSIDARIRKAGGLIAVGSHGNDQGIGAHNELWALQMGGISNLQALQNATIMGAQALGIQNDVGSIEIGKIADLIVLNSNPLDDIHNTRDIRYVMQNGFLYDARNLNTIWPAFKKRPDWILHSNHQVPIQQTGTE
jgi:Tol biopolymer transport system component